MTIPNITFLILSLSNALPHICPYTLIMFFQTVLQSLLKKKRDRSIQDTDLSQKQPSPLVQRIFMKMRKLSAAKKSEMASEKNSLEQKPK